MSESLLLEHDPVDQPAAADPVERSTWSALRIRIGRRFASRLWDKALKDERTTLYAPVFPVAEWIVQNWWPLLNELSLSETLPQRAIDPRQALLDLAPTSVADPEAIEALAHKFNASTWVIGLQLLNAGVTLSSD